MLFSNDTICAISTPKGKGGISIVKISGGDSLAILKKIFSPLPDLFLSHKVYYGYIVDNFNNIEIDEVLVIVMLSPKSYTKEDVVEIHCHGGFIVSEKIVELLIKNGCRLAEPGEFTKRAFLNGRIDLTQAEAVINLINSRSFEAVKISESLLKGSLRKEIDYIKNLLIDILSKIESCIDFEEDVENVDLNDVSSKTYSIIDKINILLKSYDYTKNFFEGINIVIAGKPNSGKSSLLNYLLKKDRAIVSSIAGTTRDTIEEELQIDGILVRLIDTAGLRETGDLIENEGVKRALEKIEKSDILIYLFDASKGVSELDKKILEQFKHKKLIVVGNKLDLISEKISNEKFLYISIKQKINLDKLENQIKNLVIDKNDLPESNIFITSLRHYQHLNNVKNILQNIDFNNQSLDTIAFDLKEALAELGKLTGEVTSEDILDKIFQDFCIGK